MRSEDLFKFIEERYSILVKKNKGLPKPWTKDKILQNYRFCNVHRENDTVTRWIKENWRDPYFEDQNIWFLMCVARLVNWPGTLKFIEPSVLSNGKIVWKPELFIKLMSNRAKLIKHVKGSKVFTGAYIVSTGSQKIPKAEYLAHSVLTPLWQNKKDLQFPINKPLLKDWHLELMQFDGMGSFMAGQVVADYKYTLDPNEVPDWNTFAASGPGSKRGLNRVYGYELNDSWTEKDWHSALMNLKVKIDHKLLNCGIPKLHAQDLQNVLCEWDKYERVRLGQGKPRSKYPGVINV